MPCSHTHIPPHHAYLYRTGTQCHGLVYELKFTRCLNPRYFVKIVRPQYPRRHVTPSLLLRIQILLIYVVFLSFQVREESLNCCSEMRLNTSLSLAFSPVCSFHNDGGSILESTRVLLTKTYNSGPLVVYFPGVPRWTRFVYIL